MKKTLTIIVLLFIFNSCSSYLDRKGSVNNDFVDFKYLESYNEFIYKSKINAVADNEIYYPNHFSINLPKKLKIWQNSGTEFFFEYNNREIIYINVGFKNKGNTGNWAIQETNEDEIYTKLNSYWNKRKYNENTLKTGSLGRTSKIYSDGKVSILLYNIKEENYNHYLDLIKSFKYLN